MHVPTFRLFLIALLAFATLAACRRPDPPANLRARAKATAQVSMIQLRAEPISEPFEQPPWIAHLRPADLDRDGRLDIVYCEARDNKVVWLRQGELGGFTAITLAVEMSAPVHVEAADMDGDGDLDLIVSSMGMVFPNNDRIGTVFILENDGKQKFTPHIVLENTSRVVDAQAADLDGDGDLDLALAQFGYDQGEVGWLERVGPWEFRRHVILELSGAINVCVADFDGDSRPDIAALISQQWEEVYFFRNMGRGTFERNRIWGSTNEDYGSSGMSISDLNRDGRPDLLFSNGDGFGPAATPGPRPWHGVQWLENTGQGFFRYHRIGNFAGAYSPVGVDFDGDGDTDVMASSAYADWNSANRDVVSLMWFRNDGKLNFEPVPLAKVPRDQITLAAGDFDGSGRPTLVTGGFSIYPPFENVSGVVIWRR